MRRSDVYIIGNMRLSAMQESNEDGWAGLSENQFTDGVNEITMDAANDVSTEDNRNLGREEGSMVSNLPLLFANGYPTSLERITTEQLERFISFMVHCSLGHDTTKVITKPQWWPQDVKFSSPLLRPRKINDNWMANLKKLVFRCYTYHRSEYLLRFCSYLARYPCEELEYVNNWDSTTSLYHKSTGKLLVTFRNENMNYDRKNDSPRRTLLSHNASSSSYNNKTKQQNTPMMIHPPCDDIYLCDNCDAEFVGLAKMKEHERICCEQDHGGSGSRSSTPDISTIEPELQQNQFLDYFQLTPNNPEAGPVNAKNTNDSDNVIVRRTSRRVRGSINFGRCTAIPFSSPAGLVLAKKSKAMTEETQQERLDRIERHVVAPALSNSCKPKWLDAEMDNDRWIVTYKPNRDKPIEDYVHQYKFVNSLKHKPTLSIRSQLLYITCRPIYAIITRLNQKQIDELKRDPSRYKCPQNDNERKVLLTKKIGPACKTRSREIAHAQNRPAFVSSKRKASLGDESDPIIVEDSDGDSINTLAANSKEALTTLTATTSPSMNNAVPARSVKERRSGSTKTIMLIDLCSSDEEEDRNTVIPPCDENRDPMNSTESLITKSSPRKSMPNHKLCARSYVEIYSATSSTDRLSNNVLNEDRNCTHKCRTGVLNEYAHLSSILRPAP